MRRRAASETSARAEPRRYHFDLRVGNLTVIDCIGQVCPTVQQALEQAFADAISISRLNQLRKLPNMIIEMRASGSDFVYEIPVSTAWYGTNNDAFVG